MILIYDKPMFIDDYGEYIAQVWYADLSAVEKHRNSEDYFAMEMIWENQRKSFKMK